MVCGLPTSLFFSFLVISRAAHENKKERKNLNVLFYYEQEKSERSAIAVEEVLN